MSYPHAEPVSPQATRCPSCGGKDLTTASKATDAAPYWRCLSCGEVWNLARHAPPSRFGYRR